MNEHYLVAMKKRRMGQILTSIKACNPSANIMALKVECFDKFGMSPSLTQKYLRELEELGKIELFEHITTATKDGTR